MAIIGRGPLRRLLEVAKLHAVRWWPSAPRGARPADSSDGRWTNHHPNPERCLQIAGYLLGARGLVTEYLELDPNWSGVPGSQLEKERDEAERSGGAELCDEVQAAVNNAGFLLFAAAQHLESLAVLLTTARPPIYSLIAVARSAMEQCANAWRLTDPSIDGRTRVARMSLERMYSAREHEKVLRETGMSREQIGDYASLEETIERIKSLGLTVSGEQVDGQLRPQITTIMEMFAGRHIDTDSRRVYRLFSAVAHGTLWGLTVFFSRSDAPDGTLSAEFAVSQGWIDLAACVAAESYAWAVENFVALLGWDEQALLQRNMALDALFGDFLD